MKAGDGESEKIGCAAAPRRLWFGPASRTLKGFTLVEIMIVVSVIGLLAMIAVPQFMKARARTKATRLAADLRVIEDAFRAYNLEYGAYPPDAAMQNGVLPVGMQSYLKTGVFEVAVTPCGGRYRWINRPDIAAFNYAYIVAVTDCSYINGPKTDLDLLKKVDEMIDDGISTSGRLRAYGGVHYHYVVDFR